MEGELGIGHWEVHRTPKKVSLWLLYLEKDNVE